MNFERYYIVLLLLVQITCVHTLSAKYNGQRVSSYPFIAGDTFRAICDYVYDEDADFDPLAITQSSIIFVEPEFLASFFANKHPLIQYPYVLVTHNSDESVPGAFVHYLEDQKLIHWFGQNPSVVHPKFSPIPIGIANQFWPHGNVSVFQPCSEQKRDIKKQHLLYINFSIPPELTIDEGFIIYRKERLEAYNALIPVPGVYQTAPKDITQYLQELTAAYFVASPRGHGLDCHRTWEALLMGAIPIVKTSPLDAIYGNLPVVIVKEWSEITPAFLQCAYDQISLKKFDINTLYAQYWIDIIRKTLADFVQT